MSNLKAFSFMKDIYNQILVNDMAFLFSNITPKKLQETVEIFNKMKNYK